MFKLQVLISTIIFSLLLIGTSFIKNQTREIEKNISNLSKVINQKKRDLNESELDYSYLTSPSIIEQKIEHLDNSKYVPMEYSKIFLNLNSFLDLQKKFANQNENYEKKIQKEK
tara:strand:- start:354 stop:695 length:342 start_codon:yes stop_codon:yes gene_type:complete